MKRNIPLMLFLVIILSFSVIAIYGYLYTNSPKYELEEFEKSFNNGYVFFSQYENEDNLLIRYDYTKLVLILDSKVSEQEIVEIRKHLTNEDFIYLSKEELLNDLLSSLKQDEIMKNYYKNNNPFCDYIIIDYRNKDLLEIKNGVNVLKFNNKVQVKEAGDFANDFEQEYKKDLAEQYKGINLNMNTINEKELDNKISEITVNAFIKAINSEQTLTFIASSHTEIIGRKNTRSYWKIYGIKEFLDTKEFFDKYFL